MAVLEMVNVLIESCRLQHTYETLFAKNGSRYMIGRVRVDGGGG